MNTQRRQIKFLERKEVNTLIRTIGTEKPRDLRDRALLEVLFSTGMRIHEALKLPRLDFYNPKLEGWGMGTKMVTKEMTIIGKGGWQRVVFFSPEAMEAVRAWVMAREDEDDMLFPITSRCAQLMIKRRAKDAGIEKRVTPHILRHSLATDLLRNGVDIRFVSEFLGHRSLNNTLIYTHVVNEQLRSIHKKLYK